MAPGWAARYPSSGRSVWGCQPDIDRYSKASPAIPTHRNVQLAYPQLAPGSAIAGPQLSETLRAQPRHRDRRLDVTAAYTTWSSNQHTCASSASMGRTTLLACMTMHSPASPTPRLLFGRHEQTLHQKESNSFNAPFGSRWRGRAHSWAAGSSNRTHATPAATLPFASVSASQSLANSNTTASTNSATDSGGSPIGRHTRISDPSEDPYRLVPVPASLDRQPLLPAERAARPTTVCVTGASGYLGSRAVERLLAAGHRVHAVVLPRELESTGALRHLQDLPGATQRLSLFPGDVLQPWREGGLAAALGGCSGLLHLAAVVDLLPGTKQQGLMVDTALRGTREVLGCVDATPSVRRVVVSSSVAAVVADNWERGRGHVYGEADWAQDCSPGYNTYSYSKSTSERLAYQLAGQQQHQQLTHTQQEQQQAGNGHGTVSHEGPRGGGAAAAAGGDTAAAGGGQGQQGPRWSLASVNPGVVFGPVRVAAHARSSPGMVKAVLCREPLVDLQSAFADVDDVAAVLCATLMDSRATGRHLVVSQCCGISEIGQRLSRLRPGFEPSMLQVPPWLVRAIPGFAWKALGTDAALVKATLAKPLAVDASKACRTLGLSYTPFDDTLDTCAASLAALGLVPEPGAGSSTAR